LPAIQMVVASYSIATSEGAFFALRPLSTSLWSGSVSVPIYLSGQKLEPGGPTKPFAAIDLETCARTFLQAVDLICRRRTPCPDRR
jgi:hypothetical protein